MNTFPQATSIDQVLRYIKENKLTFVYISKENCGICHVIQPQVQEMLTEFPAIKPIQVSADDIPEVASQFTVFTVPALLLFVEGKEESGDMTFKTSLAFTLRVSTNSNFFLDSG